MEETGAMSRPVAMLLILAFLMPATAWAQENAHPAEPNKAGFEKLDQQSWPLGASGEEDEDGHTLLAMATLGVVGAPFLGPMALLGDSYQAPAGFPRRPYAGGRPGYLWLDRAALSPPDTPLPPPPPGVKRWAVRLSVEEGNDFDHVNRLGGELRLDTQSRLGVLGHWNWYHEVFSCGCTEDFFVGDLNLTYRFAQHELAQFYTGAGWRVLTDGCVAREGVNLLYGFDLFPVQPLVISGLVDGGTLGSLGVIHTRVSLGLVRKGWELMGGYDFLRIGWVDLQGPFLGLRLWF